MDEMPTNVSASSQRICPCPELAAAGDCKPCPAGMVALASIGYDVQPAAGAPPSAKKASRMMMNAGHMNQYDSMFSFGNAMSLAPIISGIR